MNRPMNEPETGVTAVTTDQMATPTSRDAPGAVAVDERAGEKGENHVADREGAADQSVLGLADAERLGERVDRVADGRCGRCS